MFEEKYENIQRGLGTEILKKTQYLFHVRCLFVLEYEQFGQHDSLQGLQDRYDMLFFKYPEVRDNQQDSFRCPSSNIGQHRDESMLKRWSHHPVDYRPV